MPNPPEDDAITTHIITVYQLAARARRVLTGAGGAMLLPLSVADITDVLAAHPSPVPRAELDPCIFVLDAEDRRNDDE